jgi:hypothetical protein
MNGGGGHLDVFTHDRRTLSFPAERQWLAVAVVLAVATAATPRRRHSLRGLLPALVGVVLLVVLSRELAGGFFFLLWPLLALIVLAMTFGAVAPRLAVLTVGLTLAAVPAVDTYLTERGYPHSAVTTWGVAVGLFLAALLPLARLARRRLA